MPWVAMAGAALVCVATLPLVVRAARALGMVDRPTARSVHARAVPRTGGLAWGAGLLTGCLLLPCDTWTHDAVVAVGLPLVLFFVLGLVDDRWRIPPRAKFVAQGAIAALAVAAGWRWAGRGHGPFASLTFGIVTPVMTWIWLMAALTVVNFVDGIDLITCAVGTVILAMGAAGGAGLGGGSLAAVALATTLGLALGNVTPPCRFSGRFSAHRWRVSSKPCGVRAVLSTNWGEGRTRIGMTCSPRFCRMCEGRCMCGTRWDSKRSLSTRGSPTSRQPYAWRLVWRSAA